MDLSMILCPKCLRSLPDEKFGRDRSRSSGRTSHCKECRNKAAREAPKEIKNERGRRSKRKNYCPLKKKNEKLKSKYGITLDDFMRMSAAQDNKCAICGVETELVVDHCHETGRVRGLLCGHCNRGLGNFLDNPNFLCNAIDYLDVK